MLPRYNFFITHEGILKDLSSRGSFRRVSGTLNPPKGKTQLDLPAAFLVKAFYWIN